MAEKKKIKKLTKAEVESYYHRFAFPELYKLDFVPVELQLKSFSKLLAWQGIEEPETVKDDKKLEKMVFEIVCKSSQ